MDLFSVVIPLYNEEEVVLECIKRVTEVMETVKGNYEVVFVNDGSHDRTMELVQKECDKNKNLKVLSFSRNFGHQIAISAGMDYAKGDAVIVMDADLQDPPEVIKDLIAKYKEGYDVVYAVRSKEKVKHFSRNFHQRLSIVF